MKSVFLEAVLPFVTACVLTLAVPTLRAQTVAITVQPTNLTVSAGAKASFTVAATGAGPFSYQWRLNGTNIPAGIISTVAGDGSVGLNGDGGLATNATLYFPYDLAFDSTGNLYIADADNHVIRKVNTSETISTVAGDGTRGYIGDDVLATNTSLSFPSGTAVDAAGNIYISDDENYRIRKVGTNGIIVTVAGNGAAGFSGDGGAATNATLNYPQDVAVDAAGNVYIADTFNDRIRKVDTNGIITTVVGDGAQLFAGDGGAATNASLYWPSGVTVDSTGNLYIADSLNARVRKVNTTGIITTIAGNGLAKYSGDGGLAITSSLSAPSAITVDAAGNVYVADSDNNLVRRIGTNGVISTVAGNAAVAATNGNGGFSGDGALATSALLDNPQGVGVDVSGNLYISDTFNNRVREVSLAATQPTLTLTSVTAANAGNYTVVVTNSVGSVTSVVASLTVTLPTPPPLISIAATNDLGVALAQPGFKLSAATGQTIVIDASTNMVSWTPMLTNTMVLTNYYFSDTSATHYTTRFFRARSE